jgi:hypothetical protein
VKCALQHIHFHAKKVYLEPTPLRQGVKMLDDTTIYDLMQETFEHYRRFGNAEPEMDLGGKGSSERKIGFSGFHLPVCMSPYGLSRDITVGNRQNAYLIPMVCGGPSGEETQLFFDKMGLSLGSPQRDKKWRTETVPRVSSFKATFLLFSNTDCQ